ncbi:MAG: hypothetical protein IBX72_01955 [Nitrospirae bacterium]|nr:hypothetical protein [Nitrospirota bacterium]
MNIAILGAPGCVGRHIIKQLLNSPGYKIVASYRTEDEIPKSIQNEHLIWRQVNLLNQSSSE